MKISLTMKNNLIHIILFIPIVAIVTIFALTNARYEIIANLSGNANFPYTALTLTPSDSNNYVVEAGNEIKIQYEIANSENNDINTNNLQYYINITDSNGEALENIDVIIRQALDDEATFDTAVAMNYTENKGYGPINLKCDGTAESIMYDVFLKCSDEITHGEYNLKLQVYAESITNVNFNFEREVNIDLNVVGESNSSPLNSEPVYNTNNVTNTDSINMNSNLNRLNIPENENSENDNTGEATPVNEILEEQNIPEEVEAGSKNENNTTEVENGKGNVLETENVQAENNIMEEKEEV